MRRKTQTKDKIIIAVVLACFSATYFCSWKDDVLRKFVYPLQYDYMVRQYSYEDGVSPALVAAVILVESKFNEDAFSHRGASGLMQIMPDLAAADWARIKGFPAPSRGALYDPELNIEIGSWYLGRALRKWRAYRENIPMALSEYNAGARRVNQWKPVSRDGAFRERIAIPSTRDYVDEIMVKYQDYRRNWKP